MASLLLLYLPVSIGSEPVRRTSKQWKEDSWVADKSGIWSKWWVLDRSSRARRLESYNLCLHCLDNISFSSFVFIVGVDCWCRLVWALAHTNCVFLKNQFIYTIQFCYDYIKTKVLTLISFISVLFVVIILNFLSKNIYVTLSWQFEVLECRRLTFKATLKINNSS